MIRFYRRTMSKVQLLPWFDYETRDMDDIYVSLELEETTGKGSAVLRSNEDLVTLTKNDLPVTRVLVKGLAGSGKSTLLSKLVYSWSQQKSDSPLSRFELVFLISLREIEAGRSLIDVIFQQVLADDTNVSKEGLQAFIESNPSKLLVLVDGFDEYGGRNLSQAGTGIDKVMTFQVLRDCRIILTTRPHEDLGRYQSYYASVKLSGFSKENVDLYIRKFFREDREMVQGLRWKLRESEVLMSLSRIPVMLMLMCLLWEDEQKLPASKSLLYQQFVVYLWRKYCVRYSKEVSVQEGDGEFDVEFEQIINRLGCVALSGLCPKEDINQERLVFSESSFDKELFELGCQIGLLTRERLRSKLNVKSTVMFLHKSFQEFVAAKYWASLFNTNPDEFCRILMRFATWDELLSKLELVEFCCGLVGKAGVTYIINHTVVLYKKYISPLHQVQIGRHRNIGYFMEVHTMKEHDMVPILTMLYAGQIISDDENDDDGETGQSESVNNSDWKLPLIESLKSLFYQKKVLVICDSPVIMMRSPSTLSDLVLHCFFKSSYGLVALQSVTVAEFHPSLDSLDQVTHALDCMPNLRRIHIGVSMLYGSQIGPRIGELSGSNSLGERLAELSHLKSIHIETRGNYDALLGQLSTSPNCAKYLCIKNTTERMLNFLKLANLLAKVRDLKSLDISMLPENTQYPHLVSTEGNEDAVAPVSMVFDAIRGSIERMTIKRVRVAGATAHMRHVMTPFLQALTLRHAQLKEDHIRVLSTFLPQAVNLEELDLSENEVRSAVGFLAQKLQSCTKLKKLLLMRTDITGEGVCELGKQPFPSLTYLNIDMNMRNDELDTFFRNLHHLDIFTKLQSNVSVLVGDHCTPLVKRCLSVCRPMFGPSLPITLSDKELWTKIDIGPHNIKSILEAANSDKFQE